MKKSKKERLNQKERADHILSTEEALSMHLAFKEIFDQFPSDIPNHLIIENEDTGINILVENVLRKIESVSYQTGMGL